MTKPIDPRRIATNIPALGYALIGTSVSGASWQAIPAQTLANSLATSGAAVVINAAAPPTTGQVLTATSATTANWQTPGAGGSSPTIVVGADTSTSIGASSTFDVNVAIGSGKTAAFFTIKGENQTGLSGTAGVTASDAKTRSAMGTPSTYMGSTTLSQVGVFDNGQDSVKLKSAVITGTNLVLTFHNTGGAARTLSASWTVIAF